MSLILSGSDGLSDVDGSAATPAIRGTDANTGIFFPAADTIAFSEGGVEAMRIDSSGNVGIGTASPSQKLDVQGNSLFRPSGGWTAGQVMNIYMGDTNAGITYTYTGASMKITSYDNLQFWTGGTSNAERMRIDSSGNLLVGKTTTAYGTSGIRLSNGVSQTGAEFTSSQLPVAINLLAATGNSVVFSWNTVDKGYINYNGTTVAVTQVSDQRLKENIVDAPSALEKVNAIKIRSFDFKENSQHINYGVVAQELNEVVPAAVFHGVDDEDGNIKSPWAVGLEPLIPILTKAIQEQQSLIQSLTDRITALETP